MVTKYVPDASVVAPVNYGFWILAVNEFGPVQLYVASPSGPDVSSKFIPVHIGELLPTVITGSAFIVMSLPLSVPVTAGVLLTTRIL